MFDSSAARKQFLERLKTGAVDAQTLSAAIESRASFQDCAADDLMWIFAKNQPQLGQFAAAALSASRDPTKIEKLMTAYAQERRPEAQAQLAAAIAACGSSQTLAYVGRMINDKNPAARLKAARLIQGLKDWPRQTALVSALLEDPDGAVSRCALKAVAEKAPARYGVYLSRRAHDDDPETRVLCLKALIAVGGRQHADTLLARLPFETGDLRTQIWNAIVAMVKREPGPMTDCMVRALTAPQTETRRMAADLLAKMPDKQDALRRLLVFAETLAGMARDKIFEAMAPHAAVWTEPLLALAQTESDPALRLQALHLAKALEQERLTPIFLHELKSPDWMVRLAAIQALGALKHPQALPALAEALQRKEDAIAAIQALDQYRDLRAANPMLKKLPAAGEDEQAALLHALTNIGDPRLVPHLHKFLDSPAPKGKAKRIAAESIMALCRASGNPVPPQVQETYDNLAADKWADLPDLGLKLAGD